MASVVDICNLALAHLGNAGAISSIVPSDGSAEADACERYYPMARDLMLESHVWGFATKRVPLALLSINDMPYDWAFAYARPNDVLRVVSVHMPAGTGNVQSPVQSPMFSEASFSVPDFNFQSREHRFLCEARADGTQVIYTNVDDATVRYVSRITDTTKFPPVFTIGLSWLLGSYLAGPITQDMKLKESCMKMAAYYLGQAQTLDANAEYDPSYGRQTPAGILARR